jgi:membrane protein
VIAADRAGGGRVRDDRRMDGRAHPIGDLVAATRRRVRGHDLALASAGSTLYGALAAVPSLLVAIGVARLVLGEGAVEAFGGRLIETLPGAMGAGEAAQLLLRSGLGLSTTGIVLAVVMGSAYGDGLGRACARFAPPSQRRLPPAWWARAATVVLLGLVPLMLSGLLVLSPWLADINASRGLAGSLLAAYLSLTVVWVLTWVPLTWAFRIVAPGRPSWRASFVAAVVTGAFVSGFLQGFLLFLSLPVDLSRPFGGLPAVGVVSALLLWLWVLHVVVLVGYAFTWELDVRWRGPRPAASP